MVLMEYEIERIDGVEDDFNIQIDNSTLFLSERQCASLVNGLQTGGIDIQFRIGEKMHVEIDTTDDGIYLHIEAGYGTQWDGYITPAEYFTFTRDLDRVI